MSTVALSLHSNARALWYLTRGTGIVALLLLTATVLLGVTTGVRWARPRWPRFLTVELHRTLSLLVLVFLAIHIVTAVADSFAPIHWIDVVVPFVGRYRPLWLGLGALSFDLLVAITVTSLLRVRVGHRAWRFLHWGAYLCWPLAVLHGLGTGTDTKIPWVFGLTVGCLLAVLGAVWWRLATGWPGRPEVRLPAAVASVVLPVAILAFSAVGPLHKGWAKRAGTPANLLPAAAAAGSTAGSTAGSGTTAGSGSLPAIPFSATFTGTVNQQGPDAAGNVTIDIVTRLGGSGGALDVTLVGQALPQGGVSLSSGLVTLGPAGGATTWRGQVTGLDGDRLQATLSGASGTSVPIEVVLHINGSAVSGRAVVGGTE